MPLKQIILDMRSLEPFPKVATAVLALASKPGVVPSDLIEVVQTDPGITAKVLRLCNSAYYGFQREVGSLYEAGNMLGLDTLVNLVLTSSASRYFRNYGGAGADRREDLWNRSITQALASRLIAQQYGYANPDRAYTVGLLQNIGEIVLDRFYEAEFRRVQAEVATGRSALQAELVVLGIHHAEIGARLTNEWNLPHYLVDTIRYHHSPQSATADPVLASTVHLAETMLDLGNPEIPRVPHEVSVAALELTGLHPSDFDAIHLSLDREIKRATELIAA
ncbi:MAG: HDOD domain-containing protein [Planctomycetes bacterium]|nr:HDOD domain-containing protein [Planctomycetota bacterium]MCB9909231.1 HDOD domain-containing protein [Planctomycetota bacterium]